MEPIPNGLIFAVFNGMDPFPSLTIKTKYADLVELLPEHAPDVFDFASHEQVAKTVVWEAHRSQEDSKRYIERVKSRQSAKEDSIFLSWGVRELKSSKIIGLVSLTQLSDIRAQVGYVFHYEHWNSKLPVECIKALTRYSFSTFKNLERLQARCFPTNSSSINLMEKAGFHYEGVNQAMIKVKNELQDLTCFSMTRKRWIGLSLSEHSDEDFLEHI